jgi:hypothetical protein
MPMEQFWGEYPYKGGSWESSLKTFRHLSGRQCTDDFLMQIDDNDEDNKCGICLPAILPENILDF